MAYVTGSVTTYGFNNPGYRIYTLDGLYQNTTWQVLDHETYFMNLTEANLKGRNETPVWRLEYSARRAFNMTTLFPADWSALVDRASRDLNGTDFNNLFKFFDKSSDVARECDEDCKKKFACHFKQARYDEFIPCQN